MIAATPKEQLDEIVAGIRDHKIFTDLHLPPEQAGELAQKIFHPIGLGEIYKMPEDDIKDIGMVYEYLSKAEKIQDLKDGGSWPMFLTVNYLNVKDAGYVMEELRKNPPPKEL
jgi:hypothetical protein